MFSLFAVAPQFIGLLNSLIQTTDQLIMGSRTVETYSDYAWSSSRETVPRIAPAPLAWSVALRASRDISIQASIEYVVYLSALILFICFVLRIGRSREYIDLRDEPIYCNKLFSLRILA
jgi:hypothetical protein